MCRSIKDEGVSIRLAFEIPRLLESEKYRECAFGASNAWVVLVLSFDVFRRTPGLESQRTVVDLFSVIAEDEACACEAAFAGGSKNSFEGSEESGVIWRDEEDQWCYQTAGVELGIGFVALDKGVHLFVVATLHDGFVNRISNRHPPHPLWTRKVALVR